MLSFCMKYKVTIMLTFLAFIILLLALFVIRKYIYPRTLKMEGYADNKVDLIMFQVDWCPYCKSAKPVWDKLTKTYQGTNVDGKELRIISLDCTEDSNISNEYNKSIADVMNQFKKDGKAFVVEGYPTIILADRKHNVIAEFDKNTTYENLEKFIHGNI